MATSRACQTPAERNDVRRDRHRPGPPQRSPDWPSDVHDAVEDPQRIDCVNLAVANSSCQDVRDPCRTTIVLRH
jgi:hypothetical protein